MVLIMLKKFGSPCFKIGFSFLTLLGIVGCKHESNNVIYMPDMVYSPALKAQKLGSMRPPVAGTVTRDHVNYPYKDQPQLAAKLRNPLRPTPKVLAQGQILFNTYCMVCHGPAGKGGGPVTQKGFPPPPTVVSDKVRNWPDGMIFHVISQGQNLMPSYAAQIAPEERWAIIHYVRAIQRSEKPTPEDLKIAEQESK
jgi:mono/diheme cytochrome c family protein